MAVTRAIGEEEFRKMIWQVVAEDLRKRFETSGTVGIRSAFGEQEQMSFLAQESDNVDQLVHADVLASFQRFQEHYRRVFLSPPSVRRYITGVLASITTNIDVAETFASMLLDDDAKAFASWVSLTSTEGRRQLRIPQEDYFEAILTVTRHNGIGTIFLLVDEFEDVVGLRLSTRQRAEYLATLRLLIDAHVDDFSLVIALAPQAWELTKEIYPAFGDRVGTHLVDLRPLNMERAKELVSTYLVHARPEGSTTSDSGIQPFTDEAIKELVGLSGGNLRAFVSSCYRVLQAHWTSPEIDADDVRSTVAA